MDCLKYWISGRNPAVNFQDRRLWYVIAAVVVLLVIYGMWPAGEVAPPAAQ
jgi:hypothetical protein